MKRCRVIAAFALLSCCSPATAQDTSTADAVSASPNWTTVHQEEDRYWAGRAKMATTDVRRLRLTAGIQDDKPFAWVDFVDAQTLHGGRILFVTDAGNGHCLDVAVFKRKKQWFDRVWSVSGVQGKPEFCREAYFPYPSAIATHKREVMITFPSGKRSAGGAILDENTVLTYQWSGKTYELVDQRQVPAQCSLNTYKELLDQVLIDPQVGGFLVGVEALPSFHPESAIVFRKTSNGVTLSRVAFRKSLLEQLHVVVRRRTPSECIAIARTATLDISSIQMSEEQKQDFLDKLAQIDLRVNRCPRGDDGNCRYILDGQVFLVFLPDGRSIQLTDTRGIRGIRSENPALLNWVIELLKAAGSP